MSLKKGDILDDQNVFAGLDLLPVGSKVEVYDQEHYTTITKRRDGSWTATQSTLSDNVGASTAKAGKQVLTGGGDTWLPGEQVFTVKKIGTGEILPDTNPDVIERKPTAFDGVKEELKAAQMPLHDKWVGIVKDLDRDTIYAFLIGVTPGSNIRTANIENPKKQKYHARVALTGIREFRKNYPALSTFLDPELGVWEAKMEELS